MLRTETDFALTHKKLRELLKSIAGILLTDELDSLLMQQLATYNALLLETDPAKKLTGCQARELPRLFSSMLHIIDFCSLLVRLSATQPAAFQHEADSKYCDKLKKYSETFSDLVANAKKEGVRVASLLSEIQSVLHSPLIDIPLEKIEAFKEKIKKTEDVNLLEEYQPFDRTLETEIENREKEIRKAWNSCVKKVLNSNVLLKLAPIFSNYFTSSNELMAELEQYSHAVTTAKSFKSLKELATFRIKFHVWYKNHLTKINNMKNLFDLLANIDTCIIWLGTQKLITPAHKKAFDLHLPYLPNGKETLPPIDLIKKALYEFERLEKDYNEIKMTLKLNEQQEEKTQKTANSEKKSSTVAKLIHQFNQADAELSTNDKKVKTHRRRASSKASDNEFKADAHLHRTSSSKLTTHYRSAQAVMLTVIAENADEVEYNANLKI